MLPLQQQDAYRKPNWVVRMADAINEATAPDDVIVGFGLGWDPEVPYYAKRRAVMWPGWGDPRPDSPDVVRTLANLDRYTVGAFFNCFHGLPPATLALFLEHWGLQESPSAPRAVRGLRPTLLAARFRALRGRLENQPQPPCSAFRNDRIVFGSRPAQDPSTIETQRAPGQAAPSES